ncbi:MAG: OFA family MFS transporter [Polyangiaceae bacterium]
MDSQQPPRPDRWRIAVAGLVVMLCLGTIYSWSLFTRPLAAAFQWTNLEVSMVFAASIFALGTGAVVGGRLQDRVDPRVVAICGVGLWALGNLLAGLGTARLGYGWLVVTYGLIGGFGNGIAYITPVATVTKWFPEARGMAGGMVVMGFGLGAVVFNTVVANIDGFDLAARHAAVYIAARDAAVRGGVSFDGASLALSQADVSAVLSVFAYAGGVFALLAGSSALLLRNPPAGTGRRPFTSSLRPLRSLPPSEVVRTPQFYLLWTMMFVNVTAGILVISNAIPILSDLTGATPAVSAAVYGGVAVFNGLGRIFWGWISDHIGRGRAYALIFGIQAVVFVAMGSLHSLVGVGLAFAIVLLCYGGGFGTMPSLSADFFGTSYLGMNYGMILTAWGVAGLVGPLLAGFVKDHTGSFVQALLPVAGALCAAVMLPLLTRRPRNAVVDLQTLASRVSQTPAPR